MRSAPRSFAALTTLGVALLLGPTLTAPPPPPPPPPTPPLCDVTCEPDPGSPSYAGTALARPKPHNGRGRSVATVARAAQAGNSVPNEDVLPGSESYNYAIPILSLPGRNGLDLNLALFYNSRVWTIDKVNSTATLNADRDFPSYGFHLGFGYLEDVTAEFGYGTFLLTEPDGGKRELRINSLSTNIYESVDSSYIDFNSSTLVLRRKGGTQWKYQAVSGTTFYRPIEIKDTNGNRITIAYSTVQGINFQAISTITDTLGRVVTFNYDASKRVTSVTGPGFNNTTRPYAAFTWSQVALNYNFAPAITVQDSPTPSGTLINVLTQCRYTNNTGYTFEYGDWGIINKINQVSSSNAVRSYVSYNYPTAATQLSDHPTWTQQTVNDGSQPAVSTFSATKTGGLVTAFTITGPTVGGIQTASTTNLDGNGLVSFVVIKQGTTTLRTVTNTWAWVSGMNPRLTRITSELEGGQQSKIELDYAASYGNVSELREYDFGLVLVRKTQTDYLATSAYTNLHILDRPTQVRVLTAAGALKARTDFAYDTTSLTSVTGAAGHDDTNYGSAFLYRGNLTSITRYPNLPATSGAITRSFGYDVAGNTRTADVDCCQQRTWDFAPGLQYAYPTTITSGPVGTQLTVQRAYDFNTGLVTSSTDENSKTTTFSYDSMNRATDITRPDSVHLTASFDDMNALPSVMTTTPIDALNSVVQVTTTDGLGRPIKRETTGGGTTYSIVDIQNDALGRVSQISNPHGPSEAAVYTQNAYDALSRITTVTPPGGQGHYSYAYAGNVVTVTDPAAKQRRSYTDALGRLTRVDESGWGNGTPGSGSVTIGGSDEWICDPELPPDPPCSRIYDTGSVSVTVGGFTASTTYGQNSTANSIAAALRSQFNTNSSSPVTAGGSGATITLTAKTVGANTNYALSTSAQTSQPQYFLAPSFSGAPSGPTLTGGTDATTPDNPSLNTPMPTYYTYDVLDNLTLTTQGVQQRSFSFDSLSRLLTSTTPEAGTVTYTWTSFSQVATRTDARGVVTNFQYDPLHRPLGISYTVPSGSGVSAMPNVCTPTGGTPANVCFTYGTDAASNNRGRLLTMTDGTGSEAYSYDLLGRVGQLTKTIDSVAYTMGYTYNFANELLTITYPSGRVVSQAFDPIGRLNQIASNGATFLSGLAYNAASEPTGFAYGNGITASFAYNSRLQLQELAYRNGATDLFKLTYNYGTGNNGQIQSITDTVDASRSMAYTYDAWNRVKTATAGPTATPTWKLSWDYDRFGNRKNQNLVQGTGYQVLLSISETTNRITTPGYSYDASGNMTNDTLHTYTFDAENRITQVDGGATATNFYDGSGLRVKKTVGANTTRYIFSGSKPIAEYVNGALNAEYIYAGSQLLATLSSTGVPTYQHPDHLSTRVSTDTGGTVVRTFGSYPFGETWYETGAANKWKFTSYERDPESGLDYAMFRFDSSRLGRFQTPDPLAGSIVDPQSLNRYSYSQNDPINSTDRSGLTTIGVNGKIVSSPSQPGIDWNFLGYSSAGLKYGRFTATGEFVGGAWGLGDTRGFYLQMMLNPPSYCPANEQYCYYGGFGINYGSSGASYFHGTFADLYGKDADAMFQAYLAMQKKDCAELVGTTPQLLEYVANVGIDIVEVTSDNADDIRTQYGSVFPDINASIVGLTLNIGGHSVIFAETRPWLGSPILVGWHYRGQSLSAKASIIMHELAHQVGTPGEFSYEDAMSKCGTDAPN